VHTERGSKYCAREGGGKGHANKLCARRGGAKYIVCTERVSLGTRPAMSLIPVGLHSKDFFMSVHFSLSF
jgi:hypothetical protein